MTQMKQADVFQHTSYTIRRKVFKILGAAFHIYDPQEQVAFYCKQAAFKLKEDIRVYDSEAMAREVLSIKARNVIDFSAAYDVFDPIQQVKVGALRRRGIKSIVQDEWTILDAADTEIGTIREDSFIMATMRRFLSNLIPQKFNGTIHGQPVCTFAQNFNPFVLKIRLDYSADTQGLLDRRLGIAAAILLCAIEGRQQ